MCPTDNFGNHAMNPAKLRQMTAASQGAQGGQQQAPEAAAPPAAEEMPVTITITKTGQDITVQVSDDSGDTGQNAGGPQQFTSVQDALDYVSQELGESAQDEALEIPEPGAEGDDFGGEPRSPSGLSA